MTVSFTLWGLCAGLHDRPLRTLGTGFDQGFRRRVCPTALALTFSTGSLARQRCPSDGPEGARFNWWRIRERQPSTWEPIKPSPRRIAERIGVDILDTTPLDATASADAVEWRRPVNAPTALTEDSNVVPLPSSYEGCTHALCYTLVRLTLGTQQALDDSPCGWKHCNDIGMTTPNAEYANCVLRPRRYCH